MTDEVVVRTCVTYMGQFSDFSADRRNWRLAEIVLSVPGSRAALVQPSPSYKINLRNAIPRFANKCPFYPCGNAAKPSAGWKFAVGGQGRHLNRHRPATLQFRGSAGSFPAHGVNLHGGLTETPFPASGACDFAVGGQEIHLPHRRVDSRYITEKGALPPRVGKIHSSFFYSVDKIKI